MIGAEKFYITTMKLTVLVICCVLCASLIAAQDQTCSGQKDGSLCVCEDTRAGLCINNACECKPLARRKRGAPCTTHRECGWCRGYCRWGYCTCGWPY